MATTTIWRRLGYAVSFLIVAGVAAWVSYNHIKQVALYGHQPTEIAHLLPLSVDGLMLIATLAMAEDKANGRHPRGWARFSFWFGAAISTAANISATVVEHGWDPLGIGVAAFAPLALLLAIEIVARPGRSKIEPAISQVAEPVSATATVDKQPQPAITAAAKRPRQTVTTAVNGNGQRKYSERHERRLRRGK